ncbi:MAG TPA: hypothetical protein VMS21_07880 [Methylomirabilota bacterium]|nr:hypothetical protein [Methylomirabilota bacterium]
MTTDTSTHPQAVDPAGKKTARIPAASFVRRFPRARWIAGAVLGVLLATGALFLVEQRREHARTEEASTEAKEAFRALAADVEAELIRIEDRLERLQLNLAAATHATSSREIALGVYETRGRWIGHRLDHARWLWDQMAALPAEIRDRYQVADEFEVLSPMEHREAASLGRRLQALEEQSNHSEELLAAAAMQRQDLLLAEADAAEREQAGSLELAGVVETWGERLEQSIERTGETLVQETVGAVERAVFNPEDSMGWAEPGSALYSRRLNPARNDVIVFPESSRDYYRLVRGTGPTLSTWGHADLYSHRTIRGHYSPNVIVVGRRGSYGNRFGYTPSGRFTVYHSGIACAPGLRGSWIY